MIKPTNGRVVWFEPRGADQSLSAGQPLAAIVTHVWRDDLVNLIVFAPNGMPQSRTSVILHQEGAEQPLVSHARWMPYQVGQAAKAEAEKPVSLAAEPTAAPRPVLHKPKKR